MEPDRAADHRERAPYGVEDDIEDRSIFLGLEDLVDDAQSPRRDTGTTRESFDEWLAARE